MKSSKVLVRRFHLLVAALLAATMLVPGFGSIASADTPVPIPLTPLTLTVQTGSQTYTYPASNSGGFGTGPTIPAVTDGQAATISVEVPGGSIARVEARQCKNVPVNNQNDFEPFLTNKCSTVQLGSGSYVPGVGAYADSGPKAPGTTQVDLSFVFGLGTAPAIQDPFDGSTIPGFSCLAGDTCRLVVNISIASGGGSDNYLSFPIQLSAPATTPGKPGTPTAVAGNGSATLTWTPPASDGGSPILDYTATSSAGDFTCTDVTVPLECVVTGLTNGQTYTFTIKARNAVGFGPPSDSSNPVTPVDDCEGFVGVTPTRLLDTRSGPVPPGYPVGQRLSGPGEIVLDVTGVGPVPANATAVVLNVTSTQASSASGFVTVYPDGVARPTASNLNLNPGQNLPNLVTVKVGASGNVRLYTNTGAVHLIADVVGYYAPAAGDRFEGVTPTRLLDTRSAPVPPGYPAGQRLSGPGEIVLDVTGVGPVPADATAVILNVTSTQASSASGFVTVYPDGVARPTASNLNLNPGQNLPNLVVVKVGATGNVRLYTNTGAVHLIADVVGYYR